MAGREGQSLVVRRRPVPTRHGRKHIHLRGVTTSLPVTR